MRTECHFTASSVSLTRFKPTLLLRIRVKLETLIYLNNACPINIP